MIYGTAGLRPETARRNLALAADINSEQSSCWAVQCRTGMHAVLLLMYCTLALTRAFWLMAQKKKALRGHQTKTINVATTTGGSNDAVQHLSQRAQRLARPCLVGVKLEFF
jgi:hypothetical protein